MGELDDSVIDKLVDNVGVENFEKFLLKKRGVLACRSCGHKALGAIGYSDSGKCSVMSIEFSALNQNDGKWEDQGHGQPVYVAECGNCGCMSIYNARTVVRWLEKRK